VYTIIHIYNNILHVDRNLFINKLYNVVLKSNGKSVNYTAGICINKKKNARKNIIHAFIIFYIMKPVLPLWCVTEKSVFVYHESNIIINVNIN